MRKILKPALFGICLLLSATAVSCDDDSNHSFFLADSGTLPCEGLINYCDGDILVKCDTNNMITMMDCSGTGICGNIGNGVECISTKYGTCSIENSTSTYCETIDANAFLRDLICKRNTINNILYYYPVSNNYNLCVNGCNPQDVTQCNTNTHQSTDTEHPTGNPTDNPSGNPTDNPTGNPTDNPSGNPTDNPLDDPMDTINKFCDYLFNVCNNEAGFQYDSEAECITEEIAIYNDMSVCPKASQDADIGYLYILTKLPCDLTCKDNDTGAFSSKAECEEADEEHYDLMTLIYDC